MLACACVLLGAEGKWTPDQILQLDRAWLKQQGLEIPPERLWDPQTGSGLLSGVINVGGCSGAFVSPAGLFLTNHHCLFSIVQEHSTTERDLITNGFVANSLGDELASKSTRLTMPYRFTDMTKQVEAAIPPGIGDAQRAKVIEDFDKKTVADCEKNAGHRCRLASFDGGLRYVLVDALEIADVRLVYAPPRSIGEFGGEIDNFAWPRHAGDFAIGRAYVNGKPYQPKFYFPISTNGVKEGDFVMVLGYPGNTYRALTVAEMELTRRMFERRLDLLGAWLKVLDGTVEASAAGRIAVAAHQKTLANIVKNAEGQLAGLRRGRILEKQLAGERTVLEWARGNASYEDAVRAHEALAQMANEQRQTWERDFLFNSIRSGSKALELATMLLRASIERQKSDVERDPAYMERERERLLDRLVREQKSYFEASDKKLFEIWIRRAQKLGAAERVQAVDKVFGVDANVSKLYANTRVMDLNERRKMFEETPEQLRARNDALLNFALDLYPELESSRQQDKRWTGAVSRLRPAWRKAVIAHAGKPVAPDANLTLRVSIAHVKGYEPRDGVAYKPRTTVGGMVEKYARKEPFDLPKDVLDKARSHDFGRWMDPGLKDVPLDFLSDADTTGGNSGSPTVNGRGELVGANFDRVWENVANDFGYNPAVARNVNVDVRYMLWMLDRVKGAGWLLEQLGIR